MCISNFFLATTHILPVSSPENAILQQKPTSSTQTSQQQPTQQAPQISGGTGLMTVASSQASTNQQTQEQNYFTSSADTQIDSQQNASVTATSPVQLSQNGYAVSINNTNVQPAQFNAQQPQQQCIGGQAAWTARGSNTLTYTQSMQPPDHPNSRAINQTYCE